MFNLDKTRISNILIDLSVIIVGIYVTEFGIRTKLP